jgi:hypothetical protein
MTDGARRIGDRHKVIAPVEDQVSGAQICVNRQKITEPADVFRLVYRLVEDLQRVRLSHGNRVRQVLPLIPSHVTPPRGTPSWEAFFKVSAEVLEGEEARVLKLAERLLKDDQIGRWMLAQKGIGPSLGVSILGECWPLTRFPSPRHLWAFAGLHVDPEGRAVKRKKGQRANWSGRLKTRLWLFSSSYLKAGGPWRELYDARKALEYQKVGAHHSLDRQIGAAPDLDAGAHRTSGDHARIAPGEAGGVAHMILDGQSKSARAADLGDAQITPDDHGSSALAPAGAQTTADPHTSPAPGEASSGVAHRELDAQFIVERAAAQNIADDQALDARGANPGDAQDANDDQTSDVLAHAGAHSTLDRQLKNAPGEDDSGVTQDGDARPCIVAYSRLHLHNRARRFVEKALLKDLWRIAHGQPPLVGGPS